jgi:hypothetical protein
VTFSLFHQPQAEKFNNRFYLEPIDSTIWLQLDLPTGPVDEEAYPSDQWEVSCAYRADSNDEWVRLESEIEGCKQND